MANYPRILSVNQIYPHLCVITNAVQPGMSDNTSDRGEVVFCLGRRFIFMSDAILGNCRLASSRSLAAYSRYSTVYQNVSLELSNLSGLYCIL